MYQNHTSGFTISTNRYMIESTLKIARYCPLVIQGFSNFLGLFQGIMANPVPGYPGDELAIDYWSISFYFSKHHESFSGK